MSADKAAIPGRSVHLVAVGGVGMSALAGLLQARGYRVTGSDEAIYPPASTLLEQLGIEVRQEPISRDLLYLADELFMTGTAAEITPVRSVDRIAVGEGRRGEITASIQRVFFDLVEGRSDDVYGWLTPVPVAETKLRPAGSVSVTTIGSAFSPGPLFVT